MEKWWILTWSRKIQLHVLHIHDLIISPFLCTEINSFSSVASLGTRDAPSSSTFASPSPSLSRFWLSVDFGDSGISSSSNSRSSFIFSVFVSGDISDACGDDVGFWSVFDGGVVTFDCDTSKTSSSVLTLWSRFNFGSAGDWRLRFGDGAVLKSKLLNYPRIQKYRGLELGWEGGLMFIIPFEAWGSNQLFQLKLFSLWVWLIKQNLTTGVLSNHLSLSDLLSILIYGF